MFSWEPRVLHPKILNIYILYYISVHSIRLLLINVGSGSHHNNPSKKVTVFSCFLSLKALPIAAKVAVDISKADLHPKYFRNIVSKEGMHWIELFREKATTSMKDTWTHKSLPIARSSHEFNKQPDFLGLRCCIFLKFDGDIHRSWGWREKLCLGRWKRTATKTEAPHVWIQWLCPIKYDIRWLCLQWATKASPGSAGVPYFPWCWLSNESNRNPYNGLNYPYIAR